ncbi:uncharacterized protein LACBIDRAFT_335642 [Laccaria bicolor S238N-H82]|uniref:Predicted protein n=1 Tax=Laccaria bicolor (strain S238N-H82 / ATCC MYA-4686) TaxID=486041 RepID=B0E2Y0_LACBS|nr:uncharacterized protein LACBIDRAFT_335642 [Laccaria bicolor S238N-H82]EDQ98801.1 predicted protein [Laccaria bicolor S238N-H82]|eukprot:XP_001890550.1 predicted protein [Laccaria bicolor S238N-H82]
MHNQAMLLSIPQITIVTVVLKVPVQSIYVLGGRGSICDPIAKLKLWTNTPSMDAREKRGCWQSTNDCSRWLRKNVAPMVNFLSSFRLIEAFCFQNACLVITLEERVELQRLAIVEKISGVNPSGYNSCSRKPSCGEYKSSSSSWPWDLVKCDHGPSWISCCSTAFKGHL